MITLKRNTILLVALAVIVLAVFVSVPFMIGPHNNAPADVAPPEPSVFARGLVDVASRVGTPMPKVTGIVAAIHVQEGAEMKTGDPILTLDDTVARIQLAKAEAQLQAAKQKMEQAKLLPKKREAELAQLKSLAESAETTLSMTRSAYEETKRLHERSNLKSAAEVKAAQDQMKLAEHALERAKDAFESLRDNDVTQLQIKEANETFRAAELEVDAAKKTLENFILRAPKDGYVERLNVSLGDSFPPVIPNQPPILFLPKEGLIVRAELDQDRASRVKPGMKVSLQNYGEINAPKWTGTVERLGRMYRRRQSVLLEPEMVNDARVLECVIKIDPEAEKDLRLGQQLRVQIHTSTP